MKIYLFFKRMFDIIFSAFLLIILAPLFFIITILVKLFIGSPVFFKQLRPGLNSQPFTIYKFKTMTELRNEMGNLLSDAERLTKFGRFLRKTSLDELPELWNVLKGDMSFVGPRPLLMEYLPLYSKEQIRRHEARPGITGWAQINGRNAISWEDKFKLDIWYIDNYSFGLDIKIVFLTLRKVFSCVDINADNQVTMPYFTGNTGGGKKTDL